MYKLKLHTVHVLGEFITLDHVTAFISSVAPVSQSHISILLWFSCSLICTFCIHYTFEYIESQTSSCIVYKIKLAICCSFEIVHSEKAHSFIDV